MNPFYAAVIIVVVTVFASTAIVAEISMHMISGSLSQFASSEDSGSFSNSVQSVLVNGPLPLMGLANVVIVQDAGRLDIRAVLQSQSDNIENVIISVTSFPADLFQEHSERRIVTKGGNVIEMLVDGIKGTGNYKIKLRILSVSGALINSTEAYTYINPSS